MGWQIRPIGPADDTAMAAVIRTVMPEFGADGPGFAIHDPEVAAMSAAYAAPRHAYFVVDDEGRVIGGAGVAPLQGAEAHWCELRKMYLLAEGRGRGIGDALLGRCLSVASELGFTHCYLETLTGMDAAQALYRRYGFTRRTGPLGATGHFGCNRFYERAL